VPMKYEVELMCHGNAMGLQTSCQCLQPFRQPFRNANNTHNHLWYQMVHHNSNASFSATQDNTTQDQCKNQVQSPSLNQVRPQSHLLEMFSSKLMRAQRYALNGDGTNCMKTLDNITGATPLNLLTVLTPINPNIYIYIYIYMFLKAFPTSLYYPPIHSPIPP